MGIDDFGSSSSQFSPLSSFTEARRDGLSERMSKKLDECMSNLTKNSRVGEMNRMVDDGWKDEAEDSMKLSLDGGCADYTS